MKNEEKKTTQHNTTQLIDNLTKLSIEYVTTFEIIETLSSDNRQRKNQIEKLLQSQEAFCEMVFKHNRDFYKVEYNENGEMIIQYQFSETDIIN